MGRITVAVTGTDTFFGRGLIDVLAADPAVERVLAVEHDPPTQRRGKIQYRRVDLLHPRSGEQLADALKAYEIENFVHTAFVARPIHRGGWAHELEAIGTRNVLAAAEAAGVRKLILRSSTMLYGALPTNPNYLRESAPLCGGQHGAFFADKIEAEAQTARFTERNPDRVVTILRFAPMVAAEADTIATAFLRAGRCPMLLGYDPLVQVLQLGDAYAAVAAALHREVRGAVNVAAPGVLPLSEAVRAAGAVPVPLPALAARPLAETLWTLQVGNFPPGLVRFLRYLCVADTRRMEEELGFHPRYGIREAIATLREDPAASAVPVGGPAAEVRG